LLLMLNGSSGAVRFTTPEPRMEWDVLLDTARDDANGGAHGASSASTPRRPGDTVEVGAHALVVLCAQPTRDPALDRALDHALDHVQHAVTDGADSGTGRASTATALDPAPDPAPDTAPETGSGTAPAGQS